MLKFTTTSEAAAISGVKVLVYGKAGRGKTRLCATAPAPIILSAEAGLLSLRQYAIPVIQIETINDLIEAFTWSEQSAEARQFATICLDSLSEIGEVVLANAKLQVKDPRQAYGELIEKMTGTIRSFRDLKGKHVYMAAKQEPVKDDSTGIVTFGPSMPGSKLGPQLPYFFDEVFNIDEGKDAQGTPFKYLRTRPNFQFEAKDRSGTLDEFESPDLTNIFNKIMSGVQP